MADRSDALQLHARAKDHANTGDLPRAEALLLEALAVADGVDELSLVDGTLAFVEAEQGRPEEALRRCRAALARPDLTPASKALLTGQLGIVRWLGGHSHEAIELFSEAIGELDGDHRAQLLLDRGIARLSVGDLDWARADFTAGLEANDPLNAAKSAHNLGYVLLLRGELVDALRLMDGARPVMDVLGPYVTGMIDIDRVEALEASGLHREAVGLLRGLRDRLADTHLWRIQADVEIRLARLLTGDEAIQLADTAVHRYTEHGNDVEADQARAVVLQLQASLPQPPPPESLESVAHRLETAGRKESARALRVRAAGIRGDMPEPVGENAPLATRLLAGEVAAVVALDRGDVGEALCRAGAAIDEFEEWQRTIGSLELQTSTLTLSEQVLRLGQRAALASGEPAALLKWSERARELVARAVPVRPPEELGDLLAQLRHLGPEGDADERARLIEAIRHGRWHASGSVGPVEALTLDALEQALGDATFVSILRIEDEVVALTIGAGSVDVRPLGPWEAIESQLGGLGADLAFAAHSTMSAAGASLRERLSAVDEMLRPAWEAARHLVLTVPEELARVPWGQLESLGGVPITLPASATAWVRRSATPVARPGKLAVVIGPDTDTGATEAELVHRAWSPDVAVGIHHGATCPETAELAGASDVLHFCAHGHDRDAHPLLASVDLADGPWFGHDIELLPDVPDLVVLSACGVGGGSLGMARAWLHAGARRVVAAPADISETAAAERFPRLHALLADGVTPERAVAEAFGPDALDCAVQCYGPA